jgi:hypothetical protein
MELSIQLIMKIQSGLVILIQIGRETLIHVVQFLVMYFNLVTVLLV